MKLWEGRIRGRTDARMERFNRSLDFDRRLLAEDIAGSIAWAQALGRAGIVPKREVARIVKGLQRLLRRKDRLRFIRSDEDVHTAVERLLTRAIGPAGKKLHTGRSRNDQVALDLRMYLKKECAGIRGRIRDLLSAIVGLSRKNLDAVMPGLTHLQAAQPVLFSHYLLGLFFMLERDLARFKDTCKRMDIMPLGSGALAGSGFALDRRFLARTLGFKAVSDNSIDAVSDRDYIVEFLAAAAMTAMHLSRYAEDFIIFSSPGFRFIEIADAYATGSSMMPNKKNPDSLELIRGKTGRIYGSLVAVLTVLKGLPLTYNKDLQEDKEPLFDAVETLKGCLEIFSGVLRSLRVRRKNMAAALTGDLLATDLADALSGAGMPFRDAHKTVGALVRQCRARGTSLLALPVKEIRRHCPGLPKNFRLGFAQSLRRRRLDGGTGLPSVKAQLRKARAILRNA